MPELSIAPETKPFSQLSMLETIIEFFEKNNWSYIQHPHEPILKMEYQGENGEWICKARTREQPRQFLFYSILDAKIPERKRSIVSEFLTRVNHNLVVGNFEMDFDDGEVRYKTYAIDVESNIVSAALVGQLIYINLMSMDRYLPGIMSVAYANISPKDAIEQIERAFSITDAPG